MTLVCALLIVALVAQTYFSWREREKLLRRIQAPQNVIVEEAQKLPKRERQHVNVFSDEQFRRLAESRGEVPRSS